MTSLYYKVGNDNGNSEQDIIIDGNIIQQPNIMARVRKLPQQLEEINPDYVVDNIHNNIITTINSPACEAATYYCGNYAAASGKLLKNIEVGAFNSKVNSEVIVVNSLSHIAAYAVKDFYSKKKSLPKKIDVDIDMTTSLPVTQYTKDNARIFADKFLDGVHHVTVHIGTNRVDVNLNFQYVKVNPESVAVVFYLQNLKGELADKMFDEFNALYGNKAEGSYFKNKRILHIAIGEGTTEYPVTEGIQFNPNFIMGTNNGVGHAIEEVLNDFIRQKNLTKYSRQDFSNVLRDKSHKYYADAMDIVAGPLESQADIILRYAKAEVGKANNEIDIICIHGGGSILMKDYLADDLYDFGKKTDIEIFYTPEEYAVILESLGLYEFTQSDLFNKLKEKFLSKNSAAATKERE